MDKEEHWGRVGKVLYSEHIPLWLEEGMMNLGPVAGFSCATEDFRR
jgi:hypothetical protein